MPQTANKYYLTQTRQIFHCHIKIKIPLSSDESLLDNCFSLMQNIDTKYNSYQKGSFFDCINQNAGSWVKVDKTTIQLLQKLKLASYATEGHYDITSMPLLRLWGFYKNDVTQTPCDNAIVTTLKLIDFQQIKIRDNHVKINVGQEIITGSFIKAYAVDCVINYLKTVGITDALINAGGSTFATLNDHSHPEWFINLPHPFIPNQHFERISLASGFFSMSASKSSYLEIKGKKYGHIISAKTGWPVDNLQAGIVADSALDADILATALFCTPASLLSQSIEQLKNDFRFTCYHINRDAQLYNDGFKLKTTIL